MSGKASGHMLQYTHTVPDRETRAISANLLEAMQFFGRARCDGGVQQHPGVCLISCGLNYAAFNAAILSEPAGLDIYEFRRRLELPAQHFETQDLRWTCWFCDDYLQAKAQREARSVLHRLGLSPLTDPPGLFADHLVPPKRALPAIQIRRVDDEQTRLAFSHITSVSFEIPFQVCRAIYGGEGAWKGSFEGYVGYSGDAAVTTTATVASVDAIGLYSVATLPHYRRHGYAEATMRQALRIARERTGLEATVLQSTSSGLSLYQQMGFRKFTRFSVYIS